MAHGEKGTLYNAGPALLARCPGCGEIIGMTIEGAGAWRMTGYPEAVTLSPSVVHLRNGNGCGWHGWLQNGEWRSC